MRLKKDRFMGKRFLILLKVSIIYLMVNCQSTSGKNEIHGTSMGSNLDFQSLSRKDYKVMPAVTGEASFTRTRILIFVGYNFGILGIASEHNAGSVSSIPFSLTPTSPLDFAKQTAIFNAIEKVPSADALLQPRFNTSCESMQAIFYSVEKCKVKVIGKPIAIIEG